MSAGLNDILAVALGAIASIATGPFGGLDIPEGEFDETFRAPPAGFSAMLRDAEGQKIGEMRGAGAIAVDLDRLPPHFLDAVLAAEDHRFMEHDGVDPIGLAAAALSQVGSRPRGGSSITQQMIKNRVLSPDRTLERKLLEAILAIRAHHELGTKGVMRTYLESAWFGRGQQGVMGAARAWFGKDWEQITLGEAAFLAGLLQGPARLDPLDHPEAALARRNLVLRRMATLGWVTDVEAALAEAEELVVIPRARHETDPATWVAARLDRDMDQLARQGTLPRGLSELEISTSVDMRWQAIAERSLAQTIERLSGFDPIGRVDAAEISALQGEDAAASRSAARTIIARAPVGPGGTPAVMLEATEGGWIALLLSASKVEQVVLTPGPGVKPVRGDVMIAAQRGEARLALARPRIQGALVAIDPRNGAVLATVGGYDPAVSGFDRTMAMRQPGSAIKPFLYGAALDLGIDARSTIPNTPETFIEPDGVRWSPGNYDGMSSRELPLRSALEQSSNLAAAHLASQIGPSSLGRVAEAAGVYERGQMKPRLTASLGAYETTLTDLVQGYATLVNDAIPRPDLAIDRIEGRDGPLFHRTLTSATPAIGGAAQEDLMSMLRGVVTRGTAATALKDAAVPVAGKTGTSQAHRDAWFVGVTPHLAIGVWLGRDDSGPMPSSVTGGTGPARTVRAILDDAHAAGLIDTDGYRDERLTSGGEWPPRTIDTTGWQAAGAATPPPPAQPPVKAQSGFILEMGAPSSYFAAPPASADREYYEQQAPVRQPGGDLDYFR